MVDGERIVDDERMREMLDREDHDTRRLISALTSDIAGLAAAREGDNSDDEHDPEGSTLAFERSQSETLLRESRQRLTEIAAALARLDEGTFGICVDCGDPIPEVRLDARPYAATCVACAS